MTNTPPLPDGSVINRLLNEAGMEDDLDLASFLLELREISADTPPTPSVEVSALMVATPVKLRASKNSRHRRMVLIVLAVVASLGMGVSAAAAVSPQVHDAAQNAITFLVHAVVPGLDHSPTRSQIPASGGTHAPTLWPTPTPTPIAPGRSDIPSVTPSPRSVTPLPRPTAPVITPGQQEPVPASSSLPNPPEPPPALNPNGNHRVPTDPRNP